MVERVAYNSRSHCAGMGETCVALLNCSIVDVYDTSTRVWGKTALTRSRYEFAAVGVQGKLLVMGGKQNSTQGPHTQGSWDLVEKLVVSTGVWASEVVAAEARSYIAAVAHRLSSGEYVVLSAGGGKPTLIPTI